MPKQAKVIRSFAVPIGGFGDAGQLADWVLFMLSDAADFFMPGASYSSTAGPHAYFRAEDWPRSVPAHGLLSYLKRFRGFSRVGLIVCPSRATARQPLRFPPLLAERHPFDQAFVRRH